MIEKIIEILGSEILICRELVSLALEKREFIINNEAENLTNNIVKGELLVKQIYQLKEMKDQLLKSENVSSISEIRQLLPAEKATMIDSLIVEKKEVAELLRKEEGLNQRLVENQLDVVKFMLNQMKPKDVIPTYDRRGIQNKTGNLIGVNFKG